MADGKITIDTEINQKGAEKGTQNLQKKLDGTAKKAKTVGGNMTKYLTAPLLAIGGMGFAAADSMDQAFGKIQTATGATGEELDNLKQDFEEVFTEVPDSADQVADALGSLNTITGATGEDLQGLTENVLDAARSLDEDGVEASEAFGKAMEQWQIPAEEGQDKLDGLFKVTQDYDVGLQEISSHLTEYGSVLQNAGFSMDESADLMGRLEASGLEVSRLMPGLNQAFRNWASEGKNSREEFEKTISKMKDAETETEALSIATEEFGAEGAQRMTTAVRNDAIPALDELGKGMDDAQGAIEENNEQTETFGEKMGELKNKATVGLAPLGDILIDLAENALPPVVSAIESVAEWFSDLSPVTQKVIIAIGALMAVLGPLLVMFGMLVPAITAVSLPILGIVAAVVAVIAIIATLTTLIVVYWDEIKEYTMVVWNFIKDFFSTLWEGIKNKFTTTVDAIKNGLSIAWNWIKETTMNVWNAIKDFFTAFWEGIKNIFNVTIEWVKNIIETAWNWIKESTSTIWNGIKNFFTTMWDNIKNTFSTVIEAIKTVVKAAWDWIKNSTSSVWNGIKSFITGLWNGIKSAATSAFNFIKDSISNVWNAVKSVTSSVWNGIKSTVTGIWDGLKSSVSNIFNSIKDTISDVWNSIKDTTSDIWDGIVDSIKGAINSVIGAINGMLNGIGDISISLPTVPDWVPGIGGSGGQSISFPSVPNIPSLDVGTNFVAQDGLAMLHQGEAVVPAKHNGPYQENREGVTQNIHFYNTQDSPSEYARKQKQASRQLAKEWRGS